MFISTKNYIKKITSYTNIQIKYISSSSIQRSINQVVTSFIPINDTKHEQNPIVPRKYKLNENTITD